MIPSRKCPWCGEPLTETEVEQNGCESCGEPIDPKPEPLGERDSIPRRSLA